MGRVGLCWVGSGGLGWVESGRGGFRVTPVSGPLRSGFFVTCRFVGCGRVMSGGGRVRSGVCCGVDVFGRGCFGRWMRCGAGVSGLGRAWTGMVRSGSFSPSLALRFYFPLLSALRGVAMLSEQHSLKNCCCFCLSVGAGKCFFSFVTFPCKTRFRVFTLRRSQSSSFLISLTNECAGEKNRMKNEISLSFRQKFGRFFR